MVDKTVSMFERMISHADNGTNMRFVEAELQFQVTNTGIQYNFTSAYTNSRDDFNFNKERYRDLSTPIECEGLAGAVTKLTREKMTQIHGKNVCLIDINRNDALVALRHKGANLRFIPVRPIVLSLSFSYLTTQTKNGRSIKETGYIDCKVGEQETLTSCCWATGEPVFSWGWDRGK